MASTKWSIEKKKLEAVETAVETLHYIIKNNASTELKLAAIAQLLEIKI